ncbi:MULTISPECIES: GFA family protein [unclassified Methylophaga]|jgi:hypothetical protein|uniref:GFA family protein n=1 Tax=unclassified Methylophaga TaxID=2629249 RepID=UPI000C96892C|nr:MULTISPECIES: GFA family protein [unclassified Methylophaga]MAK67813.1 aldehyde-activating protein [Methylophaga sp.]MAY18494.1 aldehyde-activating protein [Methylophaga sp.]MBN45877.1 aldehyde-activating protein [Methylophaga sp.]HAO26250.1 aldehyde-activating protein [Methylophaga sp.]HCD04991.1 aldehyde-activating protein [Methylophaga sp.]|tara:strand:- start:24961 stop:25383 length:423 start_codon:yes stop_codon:yes gene_type:complete
MNSITEQSGSCLCGNVSLVATPKSYHMGACHCETCRKWGGGPLLAVECGGDVAFEGAENISIYDSSEWAERGFCKTCGTHLFYRLKQGEMYAIPVGLFDNNDEWQLAEQVFIESKPTYYSFAEKTRNLTGEELFSQFSDS